MSDAFEEFGMAAYAGTDGYRAQLDALRLELQTAQAERDAALAQVEAELTLERRMCDIHLADIARCESRAEKAAAERDAFAKQRDAYADMAFEASGYAQEQNQVATQAIAERDAALAQVDRMRDALNQSRLAFAGFVSVQSAIDKIDALTPQEETTP